MEIVVQDNIKEFTQQLNYIQRNQVPFATSRAINDTAVDAQESVVKNVQHNFKNLKRWWLRQQPTGIKVRFSNKRLLTARVFTDVYFAERQEKGGVKTPRTGKNLAIPMPAVPRKYRTSHGAKQMMQERKNVFKVEGKGIFQRRGKKRYPIQLLWALAPSAQVKPRFHFEEIIGKVVKRRFNTHFQKRMQQALDSAKRPSRK
jgi:hypothetical protein